MIGADLDRIGIVLPKIGLVRLGGFFDRDARQMMGFVVDRDDDPAVRPGTGRRGVAALIARPAATPIAGLFGIVRLGDIEGGGIELQLDHQSARRQAFIEAIFSDPQPGGIGRILDPWQASKDEAEIGERFVTALPMGRRGFDMAKHVGGDRPAIDDGEKREHACAIGVER